MYRSRKRVFIDKMMTKIKTDDGDIIDLEREMQVIALANAEIPPNHIAMLPARRTFAVFKALIAALNVSKCGDVGYDTALRMVRISAGLVEEP